MQSIQHTSRWLRLCRWGIWQLLLLMAASSLLLGPSQLWADAPDDDYRFAKGLIKQKRWSLAASSLQKFLKEHANHRQAPNARLYLGHALRNLSKYSEARQVLRVFVKESPQNRNLPYAMFRVAECSYFLGELKSSEAEFLKFLDKYPDDDRVEQALPYLGHVQLKSKKPKEAAVNFRKAIKRYPNGHLVEESNFFLARALESLGKSADALTLYLQLASDKSGKYAARAQLSLGTVYFESKDYTKSAKAYTDLEVRFPKSRLVPEARINAGYAFYQTGNFEKAIPQFQKAAESKKQSAAANYWIGRCHMARDDYPKAIDVFRTVFEADSKGPFARNALYDWAGCEQSTRHYDQARQLYIKLVDTWPTSNRADDSLKGAAEAALSAGKLDEANLLLSRLSREYPDSPLAAERELLLGRVHQARGGKQNFQTATTHFRNAERIAKSRRTRTEARYYLARTRRQLGDTKGALRAITPVVADVMKEGANSEIAAALVLHARVLLDLKRYRQSRDSAALYVKLHPNGDQVGEAFATLALASAYLKDHKSLKKYLHNLSSHEPNSALLAQTTFETAEITYDASDWVEAALLFDELVKMGSDAPFYARGLSGSAWCLFQQKQFQKSARLFERSAKASTNDDELAAEASYLQGLSLNKAGQLQPAAAVFSATFSRFAQQKAGAGAETNGLGYFAYRSGLLAARTLRDLKELDTSDSAYQKLVEMFPKAKQLDKLLDEWALLHYEAKNYDRSDQIYRRLIKETPESDLVDDARLSLAESILASGRLQDAKKTFAALSISDKSDEEVRNVSLNHLIEIAVEQRQWKEVVKVGNHLLKKSPNSTFRYDVEFRLAEAGLYWNDVHGSKDPNDLDKSKQQLLALKAASKEPSIGQAAWFPRIWILLAEIEFRKKQYEQVEKTVAELGKVAPKSPLLYQANDVLGRSYKNQARFDQSRTAFLKVVNDKSGRRTETAAKCQFLIGETYLLQTKYEEALIAYLKVYNLYDFPQWQSRALYQAAACDEQLNHWKEAVNAYEDLIKRFPNDEYAGKAKQKLQVARKRSSG